MWMLCLFLILLCLFVCFPRNLFWHGASLSFLFTTFLFSSLPPLRYSLQTNDKRIILDLAVLFICPSVQIITSLTARYMY